MQITCMYGRASAASSFSFSCHIGQLGRKRNHFHSFHMEMFSRRMEINIREHLKIWSKFPYIYIRPNVAGVRILSIYEISFRPFSIIVMWGTKAPIHGAMYRAESSLHNKNASFSTNPPPGQGAVKISLLASSSHPTDNLKIISRDG